MQTSFDPHGTTILAVRRNGAIALGGDGQVTLGNTVMKGNARKVRPLGGGKVLAGFAGGLLLDCTVTTPFGLSALVGASTGYVVGGLQHAVLGSTWWTPLAVAGIASSAARCVAGSSPTVSESDPSARAAAAPVMAIFDLMSRSPVDAPFSPIPASVNE